jgi:acetolactate synthase-1/2/3 large subunit
MTDTNKKTGGEAIAEALIAHDVDTVFGIPGIQMDNLFDAFYHRQNALRIIHSRHEQGAAYMAMGYAQATGRTGVYSVVPGPGFLNSVTALADAVSANLPVLALTGQIPADRIGQGIGMPHELKDQLAVARGIVDWAERADHPAEVPGVLERAFAHMHSGRKSPAVFEMAPDRMGSRAPVRAAVPRSVEPAPVPAPDLLVKAVGMIVAAHAPIINVGGGAVGAEAEILALAERIGAPVIMTPAARGTLPDAHPLAHHMLTGQELWQTADLVIAIGTRFSTPALAWGRPDLPVIRVDIDSVQIRKPRRSTVEIVTSAALGAAQLVAAMKDLKLPDRTDVPDAVKERVAASLAELEPVAGFAKAIRAAAPDDTLFYSDITQFGVYARYALPMLFPRSYFLPGYQATLGWAYPAALGGQVGCPEKPVVAFAGDGGFLFNIQEMATAVHHDIPVVVIVFNNGVFGNVRLIQAKNFGARHIATELSNPDFMELAQSFGLNARRAETASDLETALSELLALRKPGLIEVPVGDLPDVWSLIKRPQSQG